MSDQAHSSVGTERRADPPGGRVCVVGSLNMDLVVRVPTLPTPGQTLLGGEMAPLPGGKGANQAVAAARAGARVAMVGAVGADDYGDDVLRAVTADGVDVAGIRRLEHAQTGIAVVMVGADAAGENMIIVASGANMRTTATDVRACRGAIEAADVTLMQLESPLDVVAEAAGIAKNAGRTVVLNAAPAQHLPDEILRHVDVVVVNRPEAAMLADLPESAEPERLLEGVARHGPHEVVLTLGSQGSIAWINARVIRAPAFRVRPVDTVAAGDAFVGTLSACLASMAFGRRENTDAACSALTLASAAGALATTRPGAIPSLPTLAEVRALAETQPECAARSM